MEHWMLERMHHWHVPGLSVAIVQEGHLLQARAYGAAAADTAEPLRVEHLLQACSISKTVTSVAVLALVQRGQLDLDEPVTRRLPAWQSGSGEPVTLRWLLCHQAGLVDPPGGCPTLDVVKVGRELGSKFEYSDGGYLVIQHLLEAVTGESFATLVQRLVLEPLGMSSSFFEQPLPPDLSRLAATGHDWTGTALPGRCAVYPYLAPGGLWTTPTDLTALMIELMNASQGAGRVLTGDSFSTMTTPPKAPYIGLGIFGGGGRYNHYGWGPGFQSSFTLYPAAGCGAVIMTNGDTGLFQEESLIGEVLEHLKGMYNWPPAA